MNPRTSGFRSQATSTSPHNCEFASRYLICRPLMWTLNHSLEVAFPQEMIRSYTFSAVVGLTASDPSSSSTSTGLSKSEISMISSGSSVKSRSVARTIAIDCDRDLTIGSTLCIFQSLAFESSGNVGSLNLFLSSPMDIIKANICL